MAKSPGRAGRRWLHLALGLVISGGALALALQQTSVGEVREVLGSASLIYLPLMFALKAASVLVKGLRWRVELQAMAEGPYQRCFRAIGLGYFANLMLPFRLGELLRVALLRRYNEQVSAGDALASIAAERILDGLLISLLVIAVLPALAFEPWILRSTLLLLALTLAAVLVAMSEPLHQWLERALPAAGALRFLRAVVGALSRGSAVMRTPRAFVLSALLTLVSWCMEAGVVYCANLAIGLGFSYGACIVITFLMTFGLLVPSAPGQVGTHQALAALIMVPFGIGVSEAVSMSVLMQVASLGTLGSIGCAVLLSESAAREILREAGPAAQE